MRADDPRHGTYAGARAHRAGDEALCKRCRTAYRLYQRECYQRRVHGSYDEGPTALTGGRWVLGRGLVMRWVLDPEPLHDAARCPCEACRRERRRRTWRESKARARAAA